METDYLAYLETFWFYFPYLFLAYVFLTLIPKSFCRIKAFADNDYETNRNKYHRCYAPDICCHTMGGGAVMPKPKQRKAVTRVYPKRHSTAACTQQDTTIVTHIKRQVEPASIQTNTHVNQIAKMFEKVPRVTLSPVLLGKKINRVTPTIQYQDADNDSSSGTMTTSTPPKVTTLNASRLSQLFSQEQLENSLNLLQQEEKTTQAQLDEEPSWMRNTSPPAQGLRTRRQAPNPLNYGAGTSTTPSTASPAASSSPLSDSPPMPSSPILFRPQLNIKSSLEDIFAAIARNAEQNDNFIYAGCKTLSPVTSIDDILSQRRLSRPLSAYSISDLLSDESKTMEDACVLTVLNQTT